MAVVIGLRYILGALGIVSLPREPPVHVVTESVSDHLGVGKLTGHAAGGGISRGVGKGGAVATESTPLLGSGGAGSSPAMEGIRPKPAAKDDDRACPALCRARPSQTR